VAKLAPAETLSEEPKLPPLVIKKPGIIPPEMLGMMIPTDDPDFEQKGDKIKRVV
jgi:hypothetical protein